MPIRSNCSDSDRTYGSTNGVYDVGHIKGAVNFPSIWTIPMLIMGIVIMAAPASARYWASLARWVPQTWKDKFDLVW